MHSFSRVIQRHEREAILQHPSAWDPIYRAELEASRVFRQGRLRRAFSPVSVVSRRPRWTADWSSSTGLHHDLHNQSSLYSPANTERPSYSPSHAESRPWQTASQFSRGPRSITCMSPSHSTEHIPIPSHWGDALVLPSPNMGDFSPLPHSAEFSNTPSHAHIAQHPETPTSLTFTDHNQSDQPCPSFDSRTVWEPPDPYGVQLRTLDR